ncbi:MAG: class I SAM-dependent DNA methyltransferase [Thermoanaerobaculia bacterium]
MVKNGALPARDYYDRIAGDFNAELETRRAYVSAVDDLLVAVATRLGSPSLLDVGCGNGARLEEILARIPMRAHAIDVSPRMVALARARGIDAREADIASSQMDAALSSLRVDLVSALWNVLGHIPSREERLTALRNMRSLLRPGGRIFFDVNNRYNAADYGWTPAIRNWVRDRIRPKGAGDFLVSRPVSGAPTGTVTHLFCLREVIELCRASGLAPTEIHFVGYARGTPGRGQWAGQLCVTAELAG